MSFKRIIKGFTIAIVGLLFTISIAIMWSCHDSIRKAPTSIKIVKPNNIVDKLFQNITTYITGFSIVTDSLDFDINKYIWKVNEGNMTYFNKSWDLVITPKQLGELNLTIVVFYKSNVNIFDQLTLSFKVSE